MAGTKQGKSFMAGTKQESTFIGYLEKTSEQTFLASQKLYWHELT